MMKHFSGVIVLGLLSLVLAEQKEHSVLKGIMRDTDGTVTKVTEQGLKLAGIQMADLVAGVGRFQKAKDQGVKLLEVSKAEVKRLKDRFDSFDPDQDGQISLSEITAKLSTAPSLGGTAEGSFAEGAASLQAQEAAGKFLRDLDRDGDNHVSFADHLKHNVKMVVSPSYAEYMLEKHAFLQELQDLQDLHEVAHMLPKVPEMPVPIPNGEIVENPAEGMKHLTVPDGELVTKPLDVTQDQIDAMKAANANAVEKAKAAQDKAMKAVAGDAVRKAGEPMEVNETKKEANSTDAAAQVNLSRKDINDITQATQEAQAMAKGFADEMRGTVTGDAVRNAGEPMKMLDQEGLENTDGLPADTATKLTPTDISDIVAAAKEIGGTVLDKAQQIAGQVQHATSEQVQLASNMGILAEIESKTNKKKDEVLERLQALHEGTANEDKVEEAKK